MDDRRHNVGGSAGRPHDDYAALLAHVHEIVVTCDDDGTVRFISAATAELLGYDAESIVGRNFADFVHPDDLDAAVRAMARWEGRVGQPRGSTIQVSESGGTWRSFHYDTVVRPPGTEPGRFIVTLWPEGTASRSTGQMRAMLANEDRIVRLASAFLHVPYEDFAKGLDAAVAELSSLEWLTRISVWTIDRSRIVLESAWDAPVDAPLLPLPNRIRIADFRMLEQLAAGEEIWLTAPLDDDPAYRAEADLFTQAGTQSVLGVPLSAGGSVVGMVLLESTIEGAEFDATHHSSIRSASAIIASALLRRDAERELADQAQLDRITGLANRWAFNLALDRALDALELGEVGAVGVALVDIDRFKLVNDSLGYRAGDRLLAEVAARFTSAAPEEAMLARLGADEFLVLHRGVASREAMVETTQDLLASLAVPIEVDEMTMALTASAGIVHLDTPGGRSEDVLRWVDLAVSRAKLAGGDTIEIDVPGDHEGTSRRLQRVSEIQRGLAKGEFVPYFQGEWDLRTGALVGAEALVRWHHPTEGLVGAVDFVPLAEATGLIDQLGHRVLVDACRAAVPWAAAIDGFVLRVNIAAQQLRRDELDLDVAEVLATSGLAPESLCLELTESTLLDDPARSIDLFARMRELGVGLAIDDFGTGYSSILQLKHLPHSALKIDQQFVAGLPDDPSDRAIVRAVLDLANAFAIDVTAEGVETEAQRDALIELGCTRAQGFLLARPESAEDFAARLAAAVR
jgi:diguanylate cyclase (GGDEF)-like protein/PAS domain S-box-containing protein